MKTYQVLLYILPGIKYQVLISFHTWYADIWHGGTLKIRKSEGGHRPCEIRKKKNYEKQARKTNKRDRAKAIRTHARVHAHTHDAYHDDRARGSTFWAKKNEKKSRLTDGEGIDPPLRNCRKERFEFVRPGMDVRAVRFFQPSISSPERRKGLLTIPNTNKGRLFVWKGLVDGSLPRKKYDGRLFGTLFTDVKKKESTAAGKTIAIPCERTQLSLRQVGNTQRRWNATINSVSHHFSI